MSNSLLKFTVMLIAQTALDSVLVCGGGSAVPGIAQKLCRELRQLLPPSMTPVAASVPEYMPPATLEHASWMGGAVLSKVSACRSAKRHCWCPEWCAAGALLQMRDVI